MKHTIIISLVLILVIFLLPMIVLGQNEPDDPLIINENNPDDSHITARDPAGTAAPPALPSPTAAPPDNVSDENLIIKALINGNLTEISMREYLFGVVAAEMSADFPAEALRAQAVAARTYIESKMLAARGPGGPPERHQGADVCDDYAHCKAHISRDETAERWGADAERYAEIIESAVRDTDSMVIVYEEQPIVAVFFAISGGRTESARSVWGTDIPYLQEVDSPGEDEASGYEGRVEMAAAELKKIILEAYPDAQLDGPASDWFGRPARSQAGGVLSLTVGGVEIPGSKIRELCGLRSANFTVSAEGDTVVFQTVGYGHGVGLSQHGAKVLAEQGKTFEEILKWYYTGVEVIEYHPEL